MMRHMGTLITTAAARRLCRTANEHRGTGVSATLSFDSYGVGRTHPAGNNTAIAVDLRAEGHMSVVRAQELLDELERRGPAGPSGPVRP